MSRRALQLPRLAARPARTRSPGQGRAGRRGRRPPQQHLKSSSVRPRQTLQPVVDALGEGLHAHGERRSRLPDRPALPDTRSKACAHNFNASVDQLAEALTAISRNSNAVRAGTEEMRTVRRPTCRAHRAPVGSISESGELRSARSPRRSASRWRAPRRRADRPRRQAGDDRLRPTSWQDDQGDGGDPGLVAADQHDHLGHRRDRLPDQPPGAQCRRRGGARR